MPILLMYEKDRRGESVSNFLENQEYRADVVRKRAEELEI
jgi:hypothetical protein